jgi:translation initiation factor 1
MDSFPDFNKATDVFDAAKNTGKIHIRVQQMGRRWITTIEGLDDDLDLKRIARGMKKSFHCSVKITATKDEDEVIQLQGDQREFLKEWLVTNEVMTNKEFDERVMIHGA